MIKKTNIDLSISPKRKNPLTVGVQLSSYDKNFHEFEISFLEKELEEGDTVNILTVFESSERFSESTTEIRDGSAFFSFDTTLIDRDEAVTNYIYLKSGDSQAEIGAFRFDVKLSEIDNGTRVIAKAYDKNYESLIKDFEKELRDYLLKLEAMNQEEDARQDEEAVRKLAESERVANEEERISNEAERISKDSERDSKIEAIEGLQADLISGAVDSVAVQQHVEERYGQLEEEYAPKLTEVTAQLAHTKQEAFRKRQLEDLDEEVLAAIEGGEGTSFNLLSIPQDGSTTPEKLSPDLFELLETIKMENLIKNASLENFDGWESRLAENAVVNDGAISFTANGAGGNFFTTITANRKVGDKYYVSAQIKTTSPNARIVMFGNSQDSTNILANGSGEWERQSFIHEVTQSDSFPLLFRISDYGSSNWQEISMTKPLVVNLTEVFGKGNEPSKIEFEVLADNLGLTDFFFTGTFTRTKILPSAISDGSLNQPEVSENYCVVNSDKIEFAFRDRGRDLKIGMGKRGPNQIFDFTTVEENINSSPSIDTNFSNYTPVLITVTDWFGPYIVKANNNIDGDNIDSGHFTGGNHGYDNTGASSGNSETGRTVSVDFYVDGHKKDIYSGSFKTLEIIWTNRIQGNNTTKVDGSGREILEETIRAEISNGKMDIFSEIKALEDITIETYYGLQTVFRESEQTYQFIGGTNRGIYQTEVENSGDKSCVGVILKGNLNLKMMIDPTVGIGDNKLASYPTYSFRRGGQKMYGNLIRGDFNLPENNVLYYAGQYDFTI